MIILLCALSFTTSVISSDAYVLLQVRKHDNNHSKVDALIHKVVPSDKFNDFARKMAGKQITIMNRSEKDTPTRDSSNKEESDKVTDFMEKTVGENELDEKGIEALTDNVDPKVMTLIAEQIGENQPKMRVHRDTEQVTGPKKIKFRSGESSLLYEVSAGSVLRGMSELLSSSAVREYVDSLSKQAAVVYRSMNKH